MSDLDAMLRTDISSLAADAAEVPDFQAIRHRGATRRRRQAVIGTAVAVWLIVQPSGGETTSNQALRPQVITPTAVVRAPAAVTPGAPQTLVPVQPTPGPPGPATPGPPPAATPGPAGGATATPRPPGTPAAGTTPGATGNTGTYTVVSGDSLSSICTKEKPASMSVNECVDRVVSLNRLSSAGEISIGQQLTVPK